MWGRIATECPDHSLHLGRSAVLPPLVFASARVLAGVLHASSDALDGDEQRVVHGRDERVLRGVALRVPVGLGRRCEQGGGVNTEVVSTSHSRDNQVLQGVALWTFVVVTTRGGASLSHTPHAAPHLLPHDAHISHDPQYPHPTPAEKIDDHRISPLVTGGIISTPHTSNLPLPTLSTPHTSHISYLLRRSMISGSVGL